MTDLKIPNLSKNSDKYIFKRKSISRKKSKRKLINESILMFTLSIIISYLIYLIPNKNNVFLNFSTNITKLLAAFFESFYFFIEICIVLFILASLVISILLIIGAFSRLLKVLTKK